MVSKEHYCSQKHLCDLQKGAVSSCYLFVSNLPAELSGSSLSSDLSLLHDLFIGPGKILKLYLYITAQASLPKIGAKQSLAFKTGPITFTVQHHAKNDTVLV